MDGRLKSMTRIVSNGLQDAMIVYCSFRNQISCFDQLEKFGLFFSRCNDDIIDAAQEFDTELGKLTLPLHILVGFDTRSKSRKTMVSIVTINHNRNYI